MSNQTVPSANIAGPTLQAYPNYTNCGRVIVSRGPNEKERANLRDVFTKAITPTLSTCNISQLLASDSLTTTYNVSGQVTKVQTSLQNFWHHVVTFDFTSICLIPTCRLEDIYSIGPNTTFVNAILDHDKLNDYYYFQWKEFVCRFGSQVELTKDAWLEEMLWKLLDVTLYADIAGDYLSLQDHDHKGSILLLRLIINRMVRSEQDSVREMNNCIKEFSIRNFPEEDVTKACIGIDYITRFLLGHNRLGSDIIHNVINGFTHASTPEVVHHAYHLYCHKTRHIYGDTLYQHLVNVLQCFDAKYNKLCHTGRWLAGVGGYAQHVAKTSPSCYQHQAIDAQADYGSHSFHCTQTAISSNTVSEGDIISEGDINPTADKNPEADAEFDKCIQTDDIATDVPFAVLATDADDHATSLPKYADNLAPEGVPLPQFDGNILDVAMIVSPHPDGEIDPAPHTAVTTVPEGDIFRSSSTKFGTGSTTTTTTTTAAASTTTTMKSVLDETLHVIVVHNGNEKFHKEVKDPH